MLPAHRVYYGTSARGPVVYCPAERAMTCEACQKDEVETILYKCPTCFKWTCDGCGRRAYGRVFCSKRCADQFFFGDEDE